MSAAALKRALGPLPGERKNPGKRGPKADVLLGLQRGVTLNKLTQAELAILLGKKKEWPVEIDLCSPNFQIDTVAWLQDCPDIIREYAYAFLVLKYHANPARSNASALHARLNLSYNALSAFTMAPHLTKCKRLFLNDNRISEITYRGMKNVVQLDLQHNRIEHLEDMSDLHKLTYLDLSGNRVTSTLNIYILSPKKHSFSDNSRAQDQQPRDFCFPGSHVADFYFG